jgi:hypothetical protein
MRRQLILAGLLTCLAAPSGIRAQSLTDVARAEEARRKAVRAPAKVYTNDDLHPDGTAAPPAAPAAAAPAPAASTAKPADAATKADAAKPDSPDVPKKDEKYWKDRITAARDTATHDKVLLDALQSRVNALSTDFVNTSDPAQRAVVEENRKTALNEMDRLTKDLAKQTKAVEDIQEEARKAGVPPGWLR